MFTRQISALAFVAAVLFMSSNAYSAQQCASGEVATPQQVVDAWRKKDPNNKVPAGKVACRFSGNIVLVPAISHEIEQGNISPVCGAEVSAASTDSNNIKDFLDVAGNIALFSPNIWAQGGGAIVLIFDGQLPKDAHANASNCAISVVNIPKEKLRFHTYVAYTEDRRPPAFAIGDEQFERPGVGNAYMRVNEIKPKRKDDGSVSYGIIFANWATDMRARTAQITVDVWE